GLGSSKTIGTFVPSSSVMSFIKNHEVPSCFRYLESSLFAPRKMNRRNDLVYLSPGVAAVLFQEPDRAAIQDCKVFVELTLQLTLPLGLQGGWAYDKYSLGEPPGNL